MEMKEVPGGRVAEKMLTVMTVVSVTTIVVNAAMTAVMIDVKNVVTTEKSDLLPEVRMKVRRLLICWRFFNVNRASLHSPSLKQKWVGNRSAHPGNFLLWPQGCAILLLLHKINLQEILSILKNSIFEKY